ncbi:MAG: hypothetical protein FJW88_07020 [Actinobacteria bacterium]|nr:hypothetical protein [Actinomycetota bacterium]
MDKLKNLTVGERVIVIAAIVLLVDSILPWYSVDLGPFGSHSKNGWGAPDSFFSILAILIGVAMGVQVILHRLEVVEFPDKLGNLAWGMVHTIAGGIAFLLVLLKWLSNSDFTTFGLYIGLLSTAALAAGGFLSMKEQGAAPASPPGPSV